MTRMQLTGLALAAVCATATPLAARAQTPMMSGTMMMPVPVVPAPMMPAPGPIDPTQVEFYSGTPVYTPGDEGDLRAAARNNRESRQYEALLRSSPGFREERMQRECGSITEPMAHQSCIDSFGDRTASAEKE